MFSYNNDTRKFSRRIFFQYFISAIVPVLVLSFFAYLTITEQLDKNADRQIYSESRSIGLTLFDRFINIESNIIFLSKLLDKPDEIKSHLWLNKMFHSIYVVENGKVDQVVFGIDATNISLSTEQEKHLESKSLLYVDLFDEQYQLMMIYKLGQDNQRYLVTKINETYLWDLSIRGTDIFCAIAEQNQFLFCSDGNKKSYERQFSGKISFSESAKGVYELNIHDKEYIGNTWDLFLEPQFGIKSIYINYFMPKKEAFLEYDFFSSVFPQTIAITLLFVYVLSSVQMRRSLVPLSRLTEGVKNIIKGNYIQKVTIDSHDEFETLGNAFNDMSKKIDDQFNKINALAKIDRLILSTPDLEYIVEVLLEYVPTVVSCNHVSVIILEDEEKTHCTVYYGTDNPHQNFEKTSLIISQHEYDELFHAKEIIKKTAEKNHESYLELLKKKGESIFLICPVRNKDVLLGAIEIGLAHNDYEPDTYHDSLRELTDRAAVAISNAQWERKLFYQAHYDALTKLPNRYLFQDRLEQALERAKRNSLSVAILFIDLDRFKSVNDSLGHAVGDKLLAEVSQILLKCVRSYDSVARFGGDEYTVIVSDISPEQIDEQSKVLAERILEMMSEPIIIDDREFYISPSIGIATYPRDANNFYDLLKNADTAMYKAKALSTGNYQFYQKRQNKETLARLELENELRHAIDKEQLALYYQPKISLRDGKIYEVEALVRWHHPDKGTISPGVFIPLAEETGLITSIGYWVMKKACLQNKLWHEQGMDINIAVNISPDQFRHPGLFEKMVGIIDESGVKPESIELEITESITIENFAKTITLLNKFKDYGLGICIDDFGTGYSSMTYLQKIPIDRLKIDKSFIENIEIDNDSASITRAIIALAHNLNLKVVAEGVETKGQYDYLNAIECDEAQGFFLSRPLPEKQLIQHVLMYNNKSAESQPG